MLSIVFVALWSPYNIFFFDGHFARSVWNTVHITFEFKHLLVYQICLVLDFVVFNQISRNKLGVATPCWAMWLNTNDVLFNK